MFLSSALTGTCKLLGFKGDVLTDERTNAFFHLYNYTFCVRAFVA